MNCIFGNLRVNFGCVCTVMNLIMTVIPKSEQNMNATKMTLFIMFWSLSEFQHACGSVRGVGGGAGACVKWR